MPPQVKLAKHVAHLIQEKPEMVSLGMNNLGELPGGTEEDEDDSDLDPIEKETIVKLIASSSLNTDSS